MQQITTNISLYEAFKEDNQTCTEASSEFAHNHSHPPREDLLEEEPKKEETKIKYRKLRQKLNSIGFQHDDKCVIIKDFSSTKKQRIMKLALDLQKQIKVQNRDYEAMELATKEIMKIIEVKRQLDLQLLRQSRFVPALFELLLKIPSLHRAQLGLSLRALETSVKILWVFASVSVNRQYLILTNRLNGLISFGSWVLGREERKPTNFVTIQYYTFKIINSLLLHRSKEQDTNTIISTTIQLILCSNVFKKIKNVLSEQFILQDTVIQAELTLQLLRFVQFVLRCATPRLNFEYITFNQNPKEPLGNQTHLLKLIEFLLQFCFSYFTQLRETQAATNQLTVESYPNLIQSSMLLTMKIANCCFETMIGCIRNTMDQSKHESSFSSFLSSCYSIVRYCKQEMQECNSNSQAKMLLNEILILLGYLALEDTNLQKKVYEIGLLQQIFNLPVQYIMDSYLREVYIPTFCCLIYHSKSNLNLFLRDNSPQPIIKLLKKEMAAHCSISKKGSASSLMSMVHISQEYSSATYETDRLALSIRFPMTQWQSLCSQLEKYT